MYLSNCWHGVMIKLSLRRHKCRVNQLIDLEVDVSFYCLRSVCHEPALASKLIAKLRDVRLKQVYLRLELSAYRSDHMIYAAGVVGGVSDRCRGISLNDCVGLGVLAEERVQEIEGHAIDWRISGSRM